MLSEANERALLAFLDKQQIAESIGRWARGIDRGDAQLIQSAFHEDGIDCHGPYSKRQSDFVEQVLPELKKRQVQQTFLMNQTIELSGDTAHAETYFIVVRKFPNDDYVEQTAGRFNDRLERRAGEWKIALRVVVSDWYQRAEAAGFDAIVSRYHRGTRDQDDPSYERPLRYREPVPNNLAVPWQYPTESSGGPKQ